MRKPAIGVIVVLTLMASAAAAQQPMGCGGEGMSMGAGRGMMMDHAMMARMDSMTSTLDSLRRVMNGTTGARRTDAMAAILNRIVQHHLDMQQQMRLGMAGHGAGPMSGRGPAECCKMDAAAPDSAAATAQHQHQ